LTVSVADDGVGILGQPVRGRGQKNMMARARAVGGTLSVSSSNLSFSSSQPGTLVQLLVPLPH
jgi:signal transduction histidine kinase